MMTSTQNLSRALLCRSFLLVIAGAVLIATTITPAFAQRPYRPTLGQRHPDFTLPNTADRQPVSLSDYRGKKVLLIHFASW